MVPKLQSFPTVAPKPQPSSVCLQSLCHPIGTAVSQPQTFTPPRLATVACHPLHNALNIFLKLDSFF